MEGFIRQYIKDFQALIEWSDETCDRLVNARERIVQTSLTGGKVIIVGNGGSASIAAHVAVDLSKNAGIRAVCFNEADLVTCYANDFGYEQWVRKALESYADKRDLIILISSSGNSPNIVNAAQWCAQNHLQLITLTGMAKDNRLRESNNGGLNFWVDSKAYNHIENVHQFWLLLLVDAIIGKTEYPA